MMELLLGVKLGALLGLLLLTLICGSVPASLSFFRGSEGGTETQRTVLSFISCFAGGVFLGACLLDIIPDYLSDIGGQLQGQDDVFPVAEFIMACGFFAVLILERLVLTFANPQGGEESEPLLPGDAGHGHAHGHTHDDPHAHSSFRSFVLFLSLSLHSVFEGLAIGLQTTDTKVLQICIAIVVHKSIMAFSLSVKLAQSAVRRAWVVVYVVAFAAMSPLGIAAGIGVSSASQPGGGGGTGLPPAILEGLAAGTFVYVTFLEILPHELNSPERRLLKVLFVLMGFAVMAGLCFIG